ncbi:uncharacterized protein F4807DRAFT_417248 [Annulohypoxylon truncatum]|uniref:uncharacterized protein n=1 Tax=Annulohypoxylon truncatum TaxID=327061 RepID=UPI002008A17C|nr:uncharacterized protein F4807DRAFT_417248 [Annulohypoxylon truncatum]KAI1212006.1 hypothetical protein F4807DRAFT_417248 [Annulohypoxylon truncatum]
MGKCVWLERCLPRRTLSLGKKTHRTASFVRERRLNFAPPRNARLPTGPEHRTATLFRIFPNDDDLCNDFPIIRLIERIFDRVHHRPSVHRAILRLIIINPRTSRLSPQSDKMSNRQMARDMQVEFQARFQAKQARREAQKAAKQDPLLKKQIQELLKKGDTAKAYQKAKVLLSKQALAQQMDQMADMAELSVSQIQANNAMNRMTHMMSQSSRTMTAAQRNMNPERTLLTLEQFKQQNEEYAVNNGIYQDAISQTTSQQVSEEAVHELLGKLADDAGVQLNSQLNAAQPSKAEPAALPAAAEPTAEEEDALQQRLRALRA